MCALSTSVPENPYFEKPKLHEDKFELFYNKQDTLVCEKGYPECFRTKSKYYNGFQ